MSKTNGIGNGLGSGASLAIGTVATVVVIGGGAFLARGGVLGQGAQSSVENTLAMLGLIDAPAVVAGPAASTAPASTTETATTQEAASTPTADEATVATAAEEPVADTPVEEPTFTLAAPKLELARFETDGSGLIAGAAQPGVEIDVLLDGTVIQNLTVEEGGEFAAFVTLEPSDQPRVISLVARFNGEELASEDSFILAPLAPVVVAEAEAETETAAPTESTTAEATTSETVATEAPGTTVASSSEGAATPETSTDVTVTTSDAAKAPVAETSETVTVASSETAPAPESTTAEATTTEPTTTETATAPTTAPAAAPTEVASATPDAPTAAASEGTAPEVTAAQTTSPTTLAEATTAEAPTTAAEQAVEADAASAPKPDVAVAVLRAGADGVTLVQPATPTAPELVGKVALDTISYSDSGDVQLAGRAKPEALVRVYLDNSPVSDITVDTSGHWSGSLTSIAPGIYTLRLDEIDPVEGKVLSRLETPFKREAPEALQPIVTAETSSGAAAPSVQAVTVQKGDTLWAISQARYGSGFLYVRVFEANKGDIRNPDLIYPGQIFTLPE
ncbi:LysM peptidoglycan-binding domain-containing protein [Arenibacterium sp. LLYu02]|uniref:LysM peptidoglycan-binding domain-containing protein n=1 Tax=Arenibacterium sp. LLYu02 TaxID=3404132 RepID=UPI003B225564